MPTLECFRTARLGAERLHSDHLSALIDFHSDADAMKELGGVRNEAQTANYLASNLEHWADHGFGVWILHGLESNEVVGRATLRHIIVSDVDEVEIGYALYPKFWARGLATEIATSLLELAREKLELELESIIGITTHPNLASQQVLRKVGFEEECDVVVKGTNCRLFRIRL